MKLKKTLKPAFFPSLGILLILLGLDAFKISGIGYKVLGIVLILLGVLFVGIALCYAGFYNSEDS